MARQKTKLNVTVVQAIRRGRARGETYASLAAAHGVSVGSVSAALRQAGNGAAARPTPVQAAAKPSGEAPAEVPPPTIDMQRSWLSETVTSLRAQAAAQREAGDATALASTTRAL